MAASIAQSSDGEYDVGEDEAEAGKQDLNVEGTACEKVSALKVEVNKNDNDLNIDSAPNPKVGNIKSLEDLFRQPVQAMVAGFLCGLE